MIRKCILEKEAQLQIEPEDLSDKADSTKLVRARVRGTKLAGNFKKMKGKVIDQSEHTMSVWPKPGKQIIVSKRDVAKTNERGSTSEQKETKSKKAHKQHSGGRTE